jgi:hypothetical protein
MKEKEKNIENLEIGNFILIDNIICKILQTPIPEEGFYEFKLSLIHSFEESYIYQSIPTSGTGTFNNNIKPPKYTYYSSEYYPSFNLSIDHLKRNLKRIVDPREVKLLEIK